MQKSAWFLARMVRYRRFWRNEQRHLYELLAPAMPRGEFEASRPAEIRS